MDNTVLVSSGDKRMTHFHLQYTLPSRARYGSSRSVAAIIAMVDLTTQIVHPIYNLDL